MQAIIMAAGKGSRLGPLTGGGPKSFIEIKGRKLIDYNLRLLQEHGVDDITIVTGFQSGRFEELAGGSRHVRLVYNPFYEMTNVLGSFYMGMEALREDFLYLHADTLCEPAIFHKMLHTDADVVLPVEYGACDGEAMKVKCRENGEVIRITKQMPAESADGEFVGIAAFRKRVIPALKRKVRQLLKEKKFDEYFEGAIQRLLDEEDFDIRAVPTGGAFWAEIDFVEDYERTLAEIPRSLTSMFE